MLSGNRTQDRKRPLAVQGGGCSARRSLSAKPTGAWSRAGGRRSLAATAALVLCGALGIGAAVPAPSLQNPIVVDAMLYPWSTLGRVNTGGQGHCTGVLISELHVLTRAHCLYNATEGRWWSPSDLHFVAGYQRDSYRVHSGVRRIHVAPRYKGGRAVLANLEHDWAVLWLFRPIGRQAGWIGLQRRDRSTVARLERGEAYVVDVGYRAGQTHVITLAPDCSIGAFLRSGGAYRKPCLWSSAGVGLAKLIFFDGEVRALMPRAMPTEIAGHNLEATRPRALPQASGFARRQSPAAILRLLRRAGFTDSKALAQQD